MKPLLIIPVEKTDARGTCWKNYFWDARDLGGYLIRRKTKREVLEQLKKQYPKCSIKLIEGVVPFD